MSENKRYIIDSRSIGEASNCIFIALRTPSGNGHDYVEQLFTKGVRHFIVSEKREKFEDLARKGACFYFVVDTLDELRRLAAEKRTHFKKEVIAIVGSRGKTVTKEWINELLPGKVKRSPRSYNSQIGVPLSILNINVFDSPIVIEAGLSTVGEMQYLEEIVRPDIVVFTNITEEHNEGFQSRKEKIQEKLIIARRAKKIIYNADNEEIDHEIKSFKENSNKSLELISWTTDNKTGTNFQFSPNKAIYKFRNGCREKEFNIEICSNQDKENLFNALVTCLTLNGVKFEDLRFDSIRPVITRMDVLEGINGCRVITDFFSNDVDSLIPAIDFINRSTRDSDRKIFIINNLVKKEFKFNQSTIKSFKDIAETYGIDNIYLADDSIADLKITGIKFFKSIEDLIDNLQPQKLHHYTILITSPEKNQIINCLLSSFEGKIHETVLEINLDSLVHNYNCFKSLLQSTTGIICMLKAYGYGVGPVNLAKILENKKVEAFAVAVTDEGVELRNHGIKCPIIILNPKAYNFNTLIRYRLEPVIYNFTLLDEIIKAVNSEDLLHYPVHIKIETGMRRLGFQQSEVEELVSILKKTDRIKVKSVFSHLAAADCEWLDDFTHSQLSQFKEISTYIEESLDYSVNKHILNTAGILRFPEYQFNSVRLGIGLYGINPINKEFTPRLKPVASFHTTVISIKRWLKGDTVGYGCNGKLNRDSVIATLPVGYADGIDRRLGNGVAKFLVNGVNCPTVGNICMDICMIDVTDVSNCFIGTKVEIFGDNITIDDIADKLGTIPYEVLTSLSQRVKRIYFRE